MKVGMDLLLWTGCPTFKDHRHLLHKLKNWGFDGVEFPVGSMTASDITLFRDLCDTLELGSTALLTLDAAEADPANPNPNLRQSANDQIRRAVDKTKALGSDLLVGPLFQGLGRFTGAGPTAKEWNWAIDTIRDAAVYANDMGIRLALEPLHRFEMYMVNTMADGARFVAAVGLPNVGLLADTYHGNIEEKDVAKAWETVGKRLFHVHISENHRGVPGSGHAIPTSIFTVLKKINYDGWLTIEAFGNRVPEITSRAHLWRALTENEDDSARIGVEFIRRHL